MRQELKQFDEKMVKAINYYSGELNSIRAGRANPSILDKVQVEYYGALSPLNQVGTVSVPEPTMIVIQPWDASILADIEKAINKADIGIAPQNDGKVIRLNFPPLTEERRKQLTKDIAKIAEDAKVAIRQIRRDSIDKIKASKKANEITEDDQKHGEEKIQKITDDFVKQIEEIEKAKSAEIMEI